MTLTRSFVRNAATTPLDARLMNMAGIVANADGTPRSGVLGAANASIVSTTGTMNLAVAAAEFATSKGKADGVAIFTNDGTVNVAIGAAPASNSRIDVLWVKHNDDTTGDANANPVFGVTAGTAAASPTKPAIPTGALELATLRVYAGTTSTGGGSNTLTNTYRMTAARGGVVPFRTRAELDTWTNPAPGQLAFDLATGDLLSRQGSAWGGVSDTGWLPAAFGTAWINAAAGEEVEYRRIGGVVYLKGRAALGSSTTVFTLPVGFRPKAVASRYIVPTSATAAGPLLVTIDDSGRVISSVNPAQPNFAGICFPVA